MGNICCRSYPATRSRGLALANERTAIDDDNVHEPLKTNAILAACFAGFSGVTLGYDLGISNGSLGPVAATFGLGDAGKSIFVGSMSFASLLGCLVGGALSDALGRRGAISVGAVLFFIGNLGMALAVTFNILILCRVFVGFGIGITLVVEPLYTAEVSPRRLRGLLMSNVEVAINIGIVLGFLASYWAAPLPDKLSWRFTVGAAGVAAFISLSAMTCLVPESPRWLALQGRHNEAEAVVHSLFGKREADATMKAFRAEIKAPKQDLSWSKMLVSNNVKLHALVGSGVAFFSHASGLEAVIMYSSLVFKEAGMNKSQLLNANILMVFMKLLAILASGYVTDSVGRRPLLQLSGLFMSVAMAVMGVAFYTTSWATIKVFSFILFSVAFSLGYGPLTFTLNAELHTTPWRAKGLAVAIAVCRATSSTVSFIFLPLVRALGYSGAFFIFAGLNLLGVLFVSACVPETKGISLEARGRGDDRVGYEATAAA